MEIQIKISFIIPCYNGKKYIHECLNSIYNQDISEEEYEVICVNDCSTDNTKEIIIDCQNKHSNLKLINHAENKRVGGARTTGLMEAKGRYVWFIDQDDFLIENVLSKLLTICETNSLDILLFNYYNVSEKREIFKTTEIVKENTNRMTGFQYLDKYHNKLFNNYDTNIWQRIFSRNLLVDNEIFFPEMTYYEDFYVSLKTIFNANSVMGINQSFYNYRENFNSVIHTEVGKSGRTLFDATLFAGKLLIELSNEIKLVNSKYSLYLKQGGVWRINQFTKSLVKITKHEKGNFFIIVKKQSDLIQMVYPQLNRINKILLNHSELLYLINPFVQLYLLLKK